MANNLDQIHPQNICRPISKGANMFITDITGFFLFNFFVMIIFIVFDLSAKHWITNCCCQLTYDSNNPFRSISIICQLERQVFYSLH